MCQIRVNFVSISRFYMSTTISKCFSFKACIYTYAKVLIYNIYLHTSKEYFSTLVGLYESWKECVPHPNVFKVNLLTTLLVFPNVLKVNLFTMLLVLQVYSGTFFTHHVINVVYTMHETLNFHIINGDSSCFLHTHCLEDNVGWRCFSNLIRLLHFSTSAPLPSIIPHLLNILPFSPKQLWI